MTTRGINFNTDTKKEARRLIARTRYPIASDDTSYGQSLLKYHRSDRERETKGVYDIVNFKMSDRGTKKKYLEGKLFKKKRKAVREFQLKMYITLHVALRLCKDRINRY